MGWRIALVVVGLVGAGASHAQADAAAPARGAPAGDVRVAIRGGVYRPFYKNRPGENAPVKVAPFWLDAQPVTNAAFQAFVVKDPRWKRGAVARVFADAEYLAHWEGDDRAAAGTDEQPVTRVSWFAARAYCSARGGRLPTEVEWEYVARADETRRDAQTSPVFVKRILAWYSRPTPDVLPSVGRAAANVWGVYDLHGLVWEWVSDFGSSIVNVDSRSKGDGQPEKFCGGSALGAADTANYAAFMRFAFRSSLRGAYTLQNLGFRCAYDKEKP
jgi:sulfatase modifying factor 1